MATCIPIKMGSGGIPASLNPSEETTLPVDTQGFPAPVLKKYPLFEDQLLLPSELTADLPDEAYEYMAAMIREGAHRLPPDQLKGFLSALSLQAKRRLDPFLYGNLSKAEYLFSKMKNSFPLFDWSVPLSNKEVDQFLAFDYEAGLMKKEAFEILGKHFPFPLPCPDAVTVIAITEEAADKRDVPLAQAEFGRIYLRLPSANRASDLKSVNTVIHEVAHAIRYLLHQRAAPPGTGHAVMPLWYEEAFAMEASGEIGGETCPAIWSHRLKEGGAYHPEPIEDFHNANYEFGAAFHAVWTERLGAGAWHELSQKLFSGETDLYKAIAEVAAQHGQAGFENETAVKATVYSWIDQVAGEITDPMAASYREIAGRRPVEFMGSHLEAFAAYAGILFESQPDAADKVLAFINQYPNSPLCLQMHALLMIRAIEAGDAAEASKQLGAVNTLVEHYGIQNGGLHSKLVRLDALTALMNSDFERFDAAIGSLVLPMDSLYARRINSELLRWHLRAIHYDPELLGDFKESLFK